MIDWTALVAPILTAVIGSAGTGIGVYVAMSNRLSVLETKMDALSKSVDKHNGIVERTYKLESDMSTMWRRHDELKDEVKELENGE